MDSPTPPSRPPHSDTDLLAIVLLIAVIIGLIAVIFLLAKDLPAAFPFH